MACMYFSGLKVVTRAMEIPLVTEAINQTLAIHSTMTERGGVLGSGTWIPEFSPEQANLSVPV